MNKDKPEEWKDELAPSRKEMLDALGLFYMHSRFTIALILSIYTAIFAILGFVSRTEKDLAAPEYLIMGAGGIFIIFLVIWVAQKIKLILRRYYKLYVSNYFYAARVHYYAKNRSHPWINEIPLKYIEEENQEVVNEFIEGRVIGEGHSWAHYKWLIEITQILGVCFILLIIGFVAFQLTSA